MKKYIFDIGGVLLNFNINKLTDSIAKNKRCEPTNIRNLFKMDLIYKVETGKMKCSDFYINHIKSNIPEMSYEEWIEAWMDNYSINLTGMKLLEKLKKKGNKVYILSNLAEYNKIAIEKKFPDFFSLCERNFFSYELGLFKPDINIFNEVSRIINEKPENCVFLDDMEENVSGARNAGMIGIHFSNDNLDSILNIS